MVAILTDTVGFIRKLPHHLVAPFQSTLEEATEADLVLHVVDASHPSWEEHVHVGEEVLDSLGVEREQTLVVLNKVDLLPERQPARLPSGRRSVAVSAVTGQGLDALRAAARVELLTAPGVTFLRVPLEETEAVQRAVQLPHRLAQRFDAHSLELAMRIDGHQLTDAGLDAYRVKAWRSSDIDGET